MTLVMGFSPEDTTVRFNVAQLLKEPVGSTRQYTFTEDIGEISDEVRATQPVEGRVKLVQTGQTLLAQAEVETEVELSCSRCLEAFRYPLSFSFEEEFYPSIDVETGLPLSVPEEEGVFTIGEDHVLDLREAIRQYALIALPMAPICRPECAGLCPHCGHNLNLGACACKPAARDARWEALQEWMQGQKQGTSGEAESAADKGRGRRKPDRGAKGKDAR